MSHQRSARGSLFGDIRSKRVKGITRYVDMISRPIVIIFTIILDIICY